MLEILTLSESSFVFYPHMPICHGRYARSLHLFVVPAGFVSDFWRRGGTTFMYYTGSDRC